MNPINSWTVSSYRYVQCPIIQHDTENMDFNNRSTFLLWNTHLFFTPARYFNIDNIGGKCSFWLLSMTDCSLNSFTIYYPKSKCQISNFDYHNLNFIELGSNHDTSNYETSNVCWKCFFNSIYLKSNSVVL